MNTQFEYLFYWSWSVWRASSDF